MGFFRLSLLALLDNKYETTGKEKKKPQDVKIQTASKYGLVYSET